MDQTGMISFVIPLLNEEGSLEALHGAVTQSVEPLPFEYEIIFVDDGSTDRSPDILQDLYRRDREHVCVLQLRRNFGKTAALTAGFARARGEFVVTLDADLQDDPGELPKLLDKLEEGYDLVSGWKSQRKDPIGKTLPSRLFNRVTSLMTGIRIHDFNCGFKAYVREAVQDIDLYGELHRYIPVHEFEGQAIE